MITLDLNKPATDAGNELDPRMADLAREVAREQLALPADHVERGRLEAVKAKATATRERIHSDLGRIINDPMTNATTQAEELQAAKEALLGAVNIEKKAVAALADHEAATGDLHQRAKALSRLSQILEQASVRATHKALVRRKVKALFELKSLEDEETALLQNAYAKWREDTVLPTEIIQRGAGLVPCTFPAGVFVDAAPMQGHKVRSAFVDGVLRAIAIAYPDLLPADLAADVVASIEADRARGAVMIPGRQTWHLAEVSGGGPTYRSRTTLEIHGVV